MIFVLIKKSLNIFILFICSYSMSYAELNISNLDAIEVNQWSSGINPEDLVGYDDFCIVSTNANGDGTAFEYHASILNNFEITDGTNILAVKFSVQQNSGASQTFTGSGVEIRYFNGALSCGDANAQVRLEATINAVDMQNAVPGIYSGSFIYQVEQTDSSGVNVPGNMPDRIKEKFLQNKEQTVATHEMNFDVNIPELIEISGLPDNINFGTLNPLNDANVIVDFCVYRNGLDGLFRITATGSGTANAFLLNNSLPYQVSFAQSGGFQALTVPGDLTQITGFIGHNRKQCNGATNTRLRLDILGSDLTGKPTEPYSGELKIMVAPN